MKFPVSSDREKILRRVGEFRELTKAVREGDVPTGGILCSQLFDLNTAAKARQHATPNDSQTTKHVVHFASRLVNVWLREP